MAKIIVAMILSSLISCGGGTSSTSTGFDTGINNSKSISSLNDKEINQLCEKSVDFINTIFTEDLICNFASSTTITTTNDKGEVSVEKEPKEICEINRNKCLNENEINKISKDVCSDKESLGYYNKIRKQLVKCNSNVDLLTKCIDEVSNLFKETFKKSGCDKPIEPIKEDFETNIDNFRIQTPSCYEFQDQCPDFNLLIE